MSAGIVVILTLTLVLPADAPDITVERRMPSVIDCMAAAHKWLTNDPYLASGIGLASGCSLVAPRRS